MKRIFSGVWKMKGRLFTKSLIPNYRTFAKSLIKLQGKEYREWDPYRSKPAAAILNGLKIFPLKEGDKVLYLGIANGGTASFFSDIIGMNGVIYGVEISERSIRDLTMVAEKRKNIVPIHANARMPETYSWIEPVDVVYQDVATDDQSEILIRNCKEFLKENGHAMIAIKARSIDVTRRPEEVYKQEIKKLKEHFEILDRVKLDPYEKDHLFLVLKWKDTSL
ncbi:MAG: fibrillarin-like rRNA/tRNA 2'-O-methyltransferase [Candidatus Aenigmatarchaeota archaeon]|nr:MAG: fibrillarin-like rRNA/tRNA 2'-O-methyltransferase [Candidatus Aenigmarchaeota archaeon]